MPTNSTRSLTRSTELIAQNSKEPQRCGSFLYMHEMHLPVKYGTIIGN